MPDFTLSPILENRLKKTYGELLEKGELLAIPKIREASDTFAAHFGAHILKANEGAELLELMHGRGGRESMVYWLEFKNDLEFPTRQFGSIAGGSAHKFGLFKRRGTNQWIDSGNNDISSEAAIALASQQRDQILSCLTFWNQIFYQVPQTDLEWIGVQKRISEIAPEIHRSGWAHKYFSVLFPDILDSYHRHTWQRYQLLKLLQMPPDSDGLYVAAGRFIELSESLKWPLLHLTAVLNEVNGPPCRYWRVGTNVEDVDVWPHMRTGRYAAIGWSQLGDLSELAQANDRVEQLKQFLPDSGYDNYTPQVLGKKSREISNFIGGIEINDVVVAAHGQRMRGLGKVTGDYYYDLSSPAEAPNRRPVEWLRADSENLFQTKSGLLTSVYQLTDERVILKIELILVMGDPLPQSIPGLGDEEEFQGDQVGPQTETNNESSVPPSSPEAPNGPVADGGDSREPGHGNSGQFHESDMLQGRSEQPTERDHMGVLPYAKGLATFISSPLTEAPLTLSIEAPWGMGKTSFLMILRRALQSIASSGPPPKIIWFNPWRHDSGDSLWAAFLYEFADQMEKSMPFKQRQLARLKFYWDAMGDSTISQMRFAGGTILALTVGYLARPVGWIATIVAFIAPILPALIDFTKNLRQDAEKAWKKEDEKERFCAAEKASSRFRMFLRAYLKKGERIYIILDDLDRCAAPKAAELLDSLQLLISGNGDEAQSFPVIFLLALDREKVAAGVAVKYREVLPFVGRGLPNRPDQRVHVGRDFGYEYLQKFIDIPFRLPNTGTSEILTYIRHLTNGSGSPNPLQENIEPFDRAKTALKLTPSISTKSDTGKEDDGTGESNPQTDEDEQPQLGQIDHRVAEVYRDLDLEKATTIAAKMLGNNPRRVKQYVNLIRLRIYLAVATKLIDGPKTDGIVSHIAKLVAIELSRPVFYRLLCEKPGLRYDLANTMKELSSAQKGLMVISHEEASAAEGIISYGLRHHLGRDSHRDDFEWFKEHWSALNASLYRGGDRFPNEEEIDAILHISPPPTKTEATAVEKEIEL